MHGSIVLAAPDAFAEDVAIAESPDSLVVEVAIFESLVTLALLVLVLVSDPETVVPDVPTVVVVQATAKALAQKSETRKTE